MGLVEAARAAREKAYAPYSQFKVGAAIRAESGQVYQGVNVENVAYPEGTCAEAGAIAAMVLGGDVKVTLATTRGARLETTVGDLLPGAFGADHMDGATE